MKLEIDVMLDYQLPRPADVLLQIAVAQMADQRLTGDNLLATSAEPLRAVAGEEGIGQRTWALAEGPFHVTYSALVEVTRPPVVLEGLAATAPRDLPAHAVPYLLPSRYVESDRFEPFVESRFGTVADGAMAAAMLAWMRDEMAYVCGSSLSGGTAMDTFVQRQGVCRDYAHLLAALARAGGIPARLVSAYAANVEPPDFHAVVELWLAGAWHLVDPTGMAHAEELVRVAVGRDATDIAFMSIFGTAEMKAQRVTVTRLPD